MDERGVRWKYLKSSFAALFGGIWALVGTLFLLAGGVPLVVSYASDPAAALLAGRVLEKGQDADSAGKVRHWLRFTWNDDSGAERSSMTEMTAGAWARFAAGDALALQAPSGTAASPAIVEASPGRGTMLLFAGSGLLVGGIGWGLVVSALRKAGRRARLLSSGKLARGTVSGVEVATNVRINRRHPSFLLFEFRDDAGGRRTGRSPFLPRGLEERWQAGASIRVAYDPLDPELCEADIFEVRAD